MGFLLMDVFDLAELIEKDLEKLGFEWDIIDLKKRPILRIWKMT